MFTLTFANPKGGTGKTTACLAIAEQLVSNGVRTGLIDADPNQNLLAWCQHRREEGREVPFATASQPKAEEVFDAIDRMEPECDVLLIDLEGVADLRFANATMTSDLVVIPLQPSPMENRQAARTAKMLRDAGRRAGKTVPHAILLTQLNGFQTSEERLLREELAGEGTPILPAGLMRREVYKTMFGEGLMLNEMLEQAKTLTWSRRRQREKSVRGALGDAEALYASLSTRIKGARDVEAA